MYQDLPLHPLCAFASLELCPHMRRKEHAVAPTHRRNADEWEAPGTSIPKPDSVVIGVTRDFSMLHWGGGIVFKAHPFKRHSVATYDETGHLQVPTHSEN